MKRPPQVKPAHELDSDRLVSVVRGWEVSRTELDAQITQARAAGVSVIVVSH